MRPLSEAILFSQLIFFSLLGLSSQLDNCGGVMIQNYPKTDEKPPLTASTGYSVDPTKIFPFFVEYVIQPPIYQSAVR